MISLNKIIFNTRVEGPGNRTAIWVQGCKHKCKECFAKHTWNKEDGKKYHVESLSNEILKQDTRGITISGGEPFDQNEALYKLVNTIAEKKDIIIFSGYTFEELLTNKLNKKILSKIDVLIDGPFIAEKREETRPFVGSKNQRFIFLSERIKKDEMFKQNNQLEIRIGNDGEIIINGMI